MIIFCAAFKKKSSLQLQLIPKHVYAFFQVVSNLTENLAYNNIGKHVLDVQGFERMPLSYQTCERNWFWRNTATDYWDKSTIIASKAGQRFNYNYLINPDNDFELAAKNRTL